MSASLVEKSKIDGWCFSAFFFFFLLHILWRVQPTADMKVQGQSVSSAEKLHDVTQSCLPCAVEQPNLKISRVEHSIKSLMEKTLLQMDFLFLFEQLPEPRLRPSWSTLWVFVFFWSPIFPFCDCVLCTLLPVGNFAVLFSSYFHLLLI